METNKFEFILQLLKNTLNLGKYDGVPVLQPENAIKRITSDYAEFTIPGGSKAGVEDLKPIQVSSLDTVGKLVFKDIKEFNRYI